jgi:hypothetical protein
MNPYTPGEWMEAEEPDDAPLISEWRSDEDDSGAAAGCAFGLALVTLCGVGLWLLVASGGAW